MRQPQPVPGDYLLGHTDAEFQRLALQDGYWLEATTSLLTEAGVTRGMRVLDLGSGGGDVSFLTASLVGSSGQVVGVDRSAEAVARATHRAEQLRLRQVSFRRADLETLTLEEPFDAIIGRFVLMYLADPAYTLGRLVTQLPRGAVVAFLDIDTTVARSAPFTPLVEQAVSWLWQASQSAGTPSDLGARLWKVFRGAGLDQPRLLIRSRLEPPPAQAACRYLAETIRSALPAMERYRIATAAEVDVDTLASRLSAALMHHEATLYPPQVIGAFTTV